MVGLNPDPGNDLAAKVQGFLIELSVADWSDPAGPIRLSGDLRLDELGGAQFFANARLFLAALAEEGGADATATGNLTRAFVGRMFERLDMPESARESVRRYNKVLNELDVGPLHRARLVCECGGLVQRRKKKFFLTKAGRELMPDECAGALYRALFLAYFRRFDLRYSFPIRDVPSIQTTMAAILWRLDAVAQDWVPVIGLAPLILLPRVYQELRSVMFSPLEKEEWILSGYVLRTLTSLGLLDEQCIEKWKGIPETVNVRVTPLWRRFISFAPAARGR